MEKAANANTAEIWRIGEECNADSLTTIVSNVNLELVSCSNRSWTRWYAARNTSG
jgi:hypothetical protein